MLWSVSAVLTLSGCYQMTCTNPFQSTLPRTYKSVQEFHQVLQANPETELSYYIVLLCFFLALSTRWCVNHIRALTTHCFAKTFNNRLNTNLCSCIFTWKGGKSSVFLGNKQKCIMYLNQKCKKLHVKDWATSTLLVYAYIFESYQMGVI